MKKFAFIKVFKKDTDILLRTIATSIYAVKDYYTNKVDHTKEEYFIIRCDCKKLWELSKKYEKFMKNA